MSNIVLVTPDETAVRGEIAPVVIMARDLAVTDVPSHESALSVIADITRAERKVVELFAEPKKAAHAAHKAITAAEGKLLNPLTEAKRLVNGKCSAYEAEQRRIAAEEARRLEAIAREAEETRRLNEAVALEDAGDVEDAEAVLNEAPAPVVVHVAPAVATVEGVSTRTTWKAEVTDKAALVAYVTAHPEWLHLLDPNMPALNALARSAREGLSIPGVAAVAETSRAVRA